MKSVKNIFHDCDLVYLLTMQQPLDYPITEDETLQPTSVEDLTYAALLDRHDAELFITEQMIQTACLRMETAQQFPFATTPEAVSFDKLSVSNQRQSTNHDSGAEAGRLLTRWSRLVPWNSKSNRLTTV